MKFSDQLTHQLTPEWRSKYLKYEVLKELIYRIVLDEYQPRRAAQEDSNEIAAEPMPVRINGELEEEFFRGLHTQLEELELFYKSQEFKLNSRLAELNNQLSELEITDSAPTNLRYRAFSRRKNDLKFAYKEFYLNLIILQNFRVLNQTGFRKINKKHDKVVVSSRGQAFMGEFVNVSYMVRSTAIQKMIDKTEEVVIRLEDGNRKKAMNSLRVPPLRDFAKGKGVFPTGYLLGSSSVLLLAMLIGAIHFIPQYGFEDWRVAYSAFRPTFLLTLFMFCYALNTKAWVKYGVNHVLIFEYDPRNRLSVSQVFEVASLGLFIWSVAGVLYIFSPVLGIHQYIVPGCLLLSYLCLFSVPLPVLFFRSRLWLLKKLVRIPLAPFMRVDFADFWLADQMNTLVTVLLDVEFYVCSLVVLLVRLASGSELEGCGTYVYGIRPIIACLPAWFRFLQCLRRYRDSGRAFPHLVNAGKYSCSLFVVFFSTLNATVKDSSGQDSAGFYLTLFIWIAAAVTNTVYTTAWDLLMDWGLFEAPCVLRKERIYPYTFLYVLAAIEDAILRCAWTLTLSVGQSNLFPQEIIAFPIAALEVLRRFVWNFFRLENEHLNNCGEFRVVRDISLKPLEFK